MGVVVGFIVPSCLAESVRVDPLAGRGEWAAGLAGTVRELTERWSLQVGAPFEPGGSSAWVAPAWDAAGEDLVLKVGWRHDEAAHEADGLRAWAGDGVVLLRDAYVCGQTSALLLERCRPGATLAMCVPEPEQDVVVAGLLRRLWSVPLDASGPPFRPLQVMCDAWVSEFWQRLATVPGVIDPGLARAGMELFAGLSATADRQVLLCTDLHAGNVLAARREPWLVIDPKPYVGDPAYDVGQHLLNCAERLAADPRGLARRMADLLDLDAGRVTGWLFARCVQESLDDPALRPVAAALAPA
jgi:streptomycin 6-kinase